MTESAAQTWLARQCEMIPGASCAVLVLGTPRPGEPAPAVGWPDGASGKRELVGAARAAAVEGRVIINGRSGSAPGTPAERRHIAVPFAPGPGITAAVAVEIGPTGPPQLRVVVDQLRRKYGGRPVVPASLLGRGPSRGADGSDADGLGKAREAVAGER